MARDLLLETVLKKSGEMTLQQTSELVASGGVPLAAGRYPAGTVEERSEWPPEAIAPELARDRYPGLLAQVFEALAHPEGYDAGLRRLDEDLRKRGPNQFARFYIEEMLGRSPETSEAARELVLHPSRRIREMLASNEFMEQHDIVLQQEFSHLSREFFFHTPKSGGTTVFEAFQADCRFCPIHLFSGYDNGWLPVRLSYLRNTILRLTDPRARHVFLYGDPSTARILGHNLKRGWDTAFAILRDPIDACLSWINYVLTLICTRPTHPDAIRWRNTLGMPEDPFLPDRGSVLALAPRILELIVPSNPMCSILGSEPHIESVLDNATILDLKIIRFEQLDEYIRFRGIARYERMNVSTRYVEFADLDRNIRLTMYEKNADDLQFYDWVGKHMSPGDGPWVEL
ncbi:MAG: hypothetical protein ACREEZ_09235 [Stellaceae bacterium]